MSRVASSDYDPVDALFGGITSTFARGAIAWLAISAGLSIPWLFFDAAKFFNPGLALFWPAYLIGDLVIWTAWLGKVSPYLALISAPFPPLLVWYAWSFVRNDDNSSGAFWKVFSLSFFLSAGPPNGWHWLRVTAVWALLSLAYFGGPRWWRRRFGPPDRP